MWITQTYLHTAEPNAKIHIYYMFEDYVSGQVELTKKIQKSLESLGNRYTQDVSLYLPNPSSADSIESEQRKILPLWEMLKGKLPGIFISDIPLSDSEFLEGNHFFVSFNVDSPLNPVFYAQTIAKAQEYIDEQLDNWKCREMGSQETGFGNRFKGFFEAVEIKPGLFGFKIDLKRVFNHFQN